MIFAGTQTVAMRDGAGLATDVYLPEGNGPFPTILIRTPYDRRSSRAQRKPGMYSGAGFAVVIQDVRGTGASRSGEPFYPWLHEPDDGPDTLRWVEKQPFCNGRIGTHGGSYLATDQWLAAPFAPQSLKCMVAYCGSHNLLDGFFHGGVHTSSTTLLYGLMMAGAITEGTGGWPAAHRRCWHLPLCDADLVDGKHNAFFQDMIRKPATDPYWRRLNGLYKPSRIRAPMLILDGWFDLYPQSLRAWDILRRQAGNERTRRHSKVLIGAWAHDRGSTRCRDLDFGPNVNYDLYWHEIRWFQHWLMDAKNGAENDPPLRLFTMGANTWQDFADWPAPDAEERPLYLHSRGRANTRAGKGVLSWEKPASTESVDRFQYDPLNPVPTLGGNYYPFDFAAEAGGGPGPTDQAAIEDRPDVLVYTTTPLKQPLEIAGPISVRLFAASSAPDTDFTAKLVDVHPDGRAICMSEGIIRASCRESVVSPSLIKPQKVYEYQIDLFDLSHVFLPGHRIRLEISSSNFPKYARNLNTGQDNYTTAETAVAEQTVHHDRNRPSALLLWVRKESIS